MKVIIKLTVFLIFGTFTIAQLNTNNPKLNEYVKTFYDCTKNSQIILKKLRGNTTNTLNSSFSLELKTKALKNYIEEINESDFLNIVEKRQKAYEDDIYKPQEYWTKHDEEIVKNNLMDSLRFGIYEGIISNHLKQLYGTTLSKLILSPLLLKIKVKEINTDKFTVDNNLTLTRIIIKAEIQDKIKGNEQFKIGKCIQFYYFPFWMHNSQSFSEDKLYFISLAPVIDNKSWEKDLALDVNETNNGITMITSDIIQDESQYFGFGNIKWQDFKIKINSLINLKRLKGE